MYHFFFRLLTAKGAMESVEDKYTGLNECHQLMIEEHNAKEANFNAEINTKDQVIVYSGTSIFLKMSQTVLYNINSPLK